MTQIGLLAAGFALAGTLFAQAPMSEIVTLERQKNAAAVSQAKELAPGNVAVTLGNQRAKVTGWAPVQDWQLWILIDDGSETQLGLQLADLRKFIEAEPPAVEIGVGYMAHGEVEIAQPLTADHALAAKALRLPLGLPGISVSPYLALVDLIQHKWQPAQAAREVLMVTSGIDVEWGTGAENPYLLRCLDETLRNGIVVYGIYFPAAGHLGHSYWQNYWGQNYLGQLTDETGGEFYWLAFGAPVSIGPYLNQLSDHLTKQYVVTFEAAGKPGFQKFKLKTEEPHLSLVGPARAYVPGS